MWITFFLLSVCIFIMSVTLAVFYGMQRKRHRLSPLHILLIGVFLADFLALFPPYYLTVLDGNGVLKSLFMVFHDTLQLFTINNDFSLILEHVQGLSEAQKNFYTVYVTFLYAFTPILTVGFGLSFFRNLSAYWKYLFNYNSDVYVFSDWNEKTAMLAMSIVEKDSRATIILTSRKKESEESEDLNLVARAVGSIDFAAHISELKLNFHSKRKKISFFFLKESSYSSSENVEEALATLLRYTQRENTFFYVFSNVQAHEAILNSAPQGKAVVRRVNSMQSLIQMFLYKNGMEIFKSAETDDRGEKRISIALVGFGSYGTEFLRALPWFCTQKGYRTEIHVFEKDRANLSSFQALYPDLNYAHKENFFDGAFYSIHFHAMSTDSLEFSDFVEQNSFTFALVLTGDNDRNLRISLRLRTIFTRQGRNPLIYTRISNPVLSEFSTELYTLDQQRYDIRLIGSIATTYSYESIIESEWQNLALNQNRAFLLDAYKDSALPEAELTETDSRFWRYELVYAGSISQSIHSLIMHTLTPELNANEIWWEKGVYTDGGRLENARWITFMYAQGYSCHEEGRANHLAQTNRFLPHDERGKREALQRF